MADDAAVLFANEAFYVAFTTRDVAAMEAVWAANAPVTCIHPGWPPLIGRAAVLESWANIMGAPSSPEIQCSHAHAVIMGEAAYVICHETIGSNTLVATNVFVREDGGWKMVHHQAAPTPPPPADDTEPPTVQ